MTAANRKVFAETLVARLPSLRRYAIALVRNRAAADDLVQDCIERALKRSDSLEDIERMGGWLRSILHHVYIDQIRRERRLQLKVADVGADIIDNIAAPDRDNESLMDFEQAMASMTFEHRQILLLVGLEGLSYREVAEELAIPIGTVMSRLARARECLRSAMAGGSFQPASLRSKSESPET